ncbi:YycH family regulatory protein [Paenibacillus sp. KN14-4R]|uniref:YycH family regulatory protein n=1 Tax=Paenibacillus sp. KN14-4R TaxID=3445773 RepID=UPI003FA079F2
MKLDRMKTVVLLLLIVGSLFQTYMLTYSSPQYERIAQGNDYIKPETFGDQMELDDLLFPDYMVFHAGNSTHTLLYPNMGYFGTILESVKQRSFGGFTRVNTFALNVDWVDIRNKRKGIELHFRGGIPMQVLQTMFKIKGDLSLTDEMITSIWIFTTENGEEVKTFFFTDTKSIAYELSGADFTAKDVEKFLSWGGNADPYYTPNGDYYLPTKPITMGSYRFNTTVISDDQLKRVLFVDPGSVRPFKERDGSQIYTDGKRGLQLSQGKHWLKYTDPIAALESKNEVLENLQASIKFINQHLGWNGAYGLTKTPHRPGNNLTNTPRAGQFEFRQYFDSYPIVQPNNEGYGLMRLITEKGIVTSYERSLLIQDKDKKNMVRTEAQLMGGEQLENTIKSNPKRYNIVSVYPAYRATETDTMVTLKPVWAIEYRDGTIELID